MNTFAFTVSTPQHSMHYTVQSASFRGTEGEFAVFAGHIPFICSVCPGICRIQMNDELKTAYIDGGLLTVDKEETILLTGNFNWKE